MNSSHAESERMQLSRSLTRWFFKASQQRVNRFNAFSENKQTIDFSSRHLAGSMNSSKKLCGFPAILSNASLSNFKS